MNWKFWKTAPAATADSTAQWQQAILAVATQTANVERACALRAEDREIERDRLYEARQVRFEAERTAHIKATEATNAQHTALLTEIRDLLKSRG